MKRKIKVLEKVESCGFAPAILRISEEYISRQKIKEAINKHLDCEFNEAWIYSEPPTHSKNCEKCALLKELKL